MFEFNLNDVDFHSKIIFKPRQKLLAMSKKRLVCLVHMKKFSFLLLLLTSSLLSFAQQKITISGKVISETNTPRVYRVSMVTYY